MRLSGDTGHFALPGAAKNGGTDGGGVEASAAPGRAGEVGAGAGAGAGAGPSVGRFPGMVFPLTATLAVSATEAGAKTLPTTPPTSTERVDYSRQLLTGTIPTQVRTPPMMYLTNV